jgi:glucosamine-6-phosphate deaminase
MKIEVHANKKETSQAAAKKAVAILNEAIAKKGTATFVMATGASQFDFIQALIADGTVDWSKTRMFHLDEYVGIPETHPASFRKYLKERFVSKVNLGEVNLVQGDVEDPQAECDRLNAILKDTVLDVAFVGIGENGHLAFNDPPADFEVEDPFIVVVLDEVCRKQQTGEGWFKSIDEVPEKAISMSVKQIMKAENIICTVPDERKAKAVKECFEGPEVSAMHPASILKQHKNAFVYLDEDSASLLEKK